MRFSFLFLFLSRKCGTAALSQLLLQRFIFKGFFFFFSTLGAKEVVGVQTSLTSTESRRCASAGDGGNGFQQRFWAAGEKLFSLEAPQLSSHSAASEEPFLPRFHSRFF